MGIYFKPLRRKVGVLTLIVACALTAVWLRSGTKLDLLFIPRICVVASANGRISISSDVRIRSQNRASSFEGTFHSYSFLSRMKFWSLDATSSRLMSPKPLITYSTIVFPLSLASAWLLLSKPRASQPKPTAGKQMSLSSDAWRRLRA